MTIDFYGIPNCDTVRKARKWLAEKGIEHRFHNYKREGADEAVLNRAADVLGWEKMLNRRGSSWRRFDETDRVDVDRNKALLLMLVDEVSVAVGFDADRYHALLF